MQRNISLSRGLLVAAAVVAGLVAAFYAVGAHAGGTRVVMTAQNKTLGTTILVSRQGMSLYTLSAERNGRFICTDATCLSVWKPLVVAKGSKPTGVAGLGTVKRPDGKIQVTYRSGPLYRFVSDRKRGDVKGNGFKDVGIWKVATVHKAKASSPQPAPRYGY
jgi:predicted lipoprotein with Yx(FWY)xxD motif